MPHVDLETVRLRSGTGMDQTLVGDSALVAVARLQDHQVVTVDEVVQPVLIIDPGASLPAARPIRELLFPQRLTNHRE